MDPFDDESPTLKPGISTTVVALLAIACWWATETVGQLMWAIWPNGDE